MAHTGSVSPRGITGTSLDQSLTTFAFEDFSNVLSKHQIEEMASADEYEVVKEVQVRLSALTLGNSSAHTVQWQEYYADYLPHYPSLFSLTNAAVTDGLDDPPNVRPDMPLALKKSPLTPANPFQPTSHQSTFPHRFPFLRQH